MKKWIFFDVMGVLFIVGDDTNDLLVPFVKKYNKQISSEEIINEYMQASLGMISSKQFWKNVGLGEFYPSIETEYLESQLNLDENCIEVLKKLNKKYNLGIIYNDVSEWSVFLRKKYNLDKYFKLSIISGDVKLRKPNKEIYELIKNHNIRYADCIFIDDRIKNLIPANELGFTTVHFNREDIHSSNELHEINSFLDIENLCNKLFNREKKVYEL